MVSTWTNLSLWLAGVKKDELGWLSSLPPKFGLSHAECTSWWYEMKLKKAMKQTWVHGKPKEHAIQNYEAVLIEAMSKQKEKKKKLYSKTSKHLEMGPQRGEKERRWLHVLYHPLELHHENCPVIVLKRILNQCTSLQQTIFLKSPWGSHSEKWSQQPDPVGPGRLHVSPHPVRQLDHCWKRS